jgi:cytochrome c-type biogenesis protein CcmH
MFWIISAIFILIALVFVLPTLLRKRNVSQVGGHEQDISRDQNIFIANEQLRELEERFEKGEIESEDYQSARDELEQSLFSDLGESDVDVKDNGANSSLLSAAFIAILIPAIAIPVYLKVGDLTFTTDFDSKEAAKQAVDKLVPKNADGSPDIETMIVGLQKKMEENPKNVTGWTMLGRSYMVLKKYPEAVKAYDRALELKPKSVDILLSVADSLAMASNGEIAGRPIELINRALELEPNNLTALWLGGMAARQQSEHLLAIKRWKKVLSLVKDPNEKREISSLISEAVSQLTPDQKVKLGIAANTQEKSATLAGITVTISLSDKFKEQANPNDLVFIYAKAMSGPPMPLAAVRKQVKDLPIEVELNDAMAMMPSLKLSAFTEVIVGARISKTGQAIAQNGDLFSEKSSVKAGEKVKLEIDTVVVK